MKYHSTGIENNQDSEEKVLIMQICSTSGLHVYSTWQGLRITPRVQVLEYMRGKLPSWTWTLLFGVCSDSFFNLQNCSCFQLELKSRDTSLCPSRFRNSIPVANDLVNSVLYRPPVFDSISYWRARRNTNWLLPIFCGWGVNAWHFSLSLYDVLSEGVRLWIQIIFLDSCCLDL